ncbi:MAG: hypothetical protein WBP88_02215 [Nitrososphaeraceae archaeon]
MQKSKLIIIVILLSITAFITSYPTSSAHLINSTRIQDWKNVKDNIEIQFSYKPDRPIIDAFTELQFSVTNLQTGEHLRDFVARVVVTNGQRLFKFENITVPNGDFSVKYIFPDDGTHQVILRVNSNHLVELASFQVFVPHQSPPSILNPFPSSPGTSDNDLGILASKILAVALPVAAVTALIVMIKKKPKRQG